MIRPKAFFPVIVTDQMETVREFFEKFLGFECVYHTDWYVHLAHCNGIQLAFMLPGHDSQPEVLHSPFSGSGLVLSFEVADVDKAYKEFADDSEMVLMPPKTEEWGRRHFLLSAPAGIVVDVLQNIDSSLEEA